MDVALISVTPADRHGYHSLGPSVDITRSALQVAKRIVAMVNPNLPRTFGDASIHSSHIDVLWHNEMPVHTLHERKNAAQAKMEGSVEDQIGRQIAHNLVQDGATLQMGIGAIPDAVLRHLGNHKDLGIHSEMFSDGVIDLVMKGAVSARASANQSAATPLALFFLCDLISSHSLPPSPSHFKPSRRSPAPRRSSTQA